MAIDLTTTEKKTFFKFLFLYLGSSFLLILSTAFFYYQNEKILYVDLVKSNMQNIISKASNEIIISHMMGYKFHREKYLNSRDYKISFYGKNNELLFGNLEEDVNFSQKFTSTNEYILLVDNSTVGHLGVEFIALKDTSLSKKISELKINILIIFLVIYSIIALIGFYLAKLFLKPIKAERKKLNNFIKDTTHELNTPISAIMMSLENENPSVKQIQRARISANRVSEIYKDLSYIFLEDHQKQKEPETIELSFLIKNYVDNFEPLYHKKNIKLDLQLEEFFYKIDSNDFERLFNNLLSNAIKYNKLNGKIEISLKNGILMVKDYGFGIEQNKINDIFKRYFRATTQSGGFGLGLNIVNIICNSYKIKIDVESIENQSTTFKLTF